MEWSLLLSPNVQGRCLGTFLQDGKQLKNVVVQQIIDVLTHTRLDLLCFIALRVLHYRSNEQAVFPRLLMQVAGFLAVVVGERPQTVGEAVVVAVALERLAIENTIELTSQLAFEQRGTQLIAPNTL